MLSIIIPVLNEEDSLRELHRQIDAVVTAEAIETEILFIDDGSTDSSRQVIESLAADDDRVFGIRFRRNFGKAAALTAGLSALRGDVVVQMDADLQDDPAEIPGFLAQLRTDDNADGFDVVNGWKQRRLDPWHKVYPSKVFNGLVGLLTGLKLHDHNCGLKAFRAEVAEELNLYGEMHRFVPVLAHARGFSVTERAVNHRPREHGVSKYGVRRFLRGFLDLLTVTFLTGYGQRPQHLLGGFGLFSFAAGLVGLAYLAVLWVMMNVFGVVTPAPIGTRPLLAYSIVATLLGFGAIALGLLAELIVANGAAVGQPVQRSYSVRQRTGQTAGHHNSEPING